VVSPRARRIFFQRGVQIVWGEKYIGVLEKGAVLIIIQKRGVIFPGVWYTPGAGRKREVRSSKRAKGCITPTGKDSRRSYIE